MRSRTHVGRRSVLAGLAAFAVVAGLAGPVGAREPEPRPDPVTGLLGGLVGGLLDVVEGVVGQVVDTGWLYDDSVTTLDDVRATIGAPTLWQRGYTGRGIGVALVDTGVVPVKGLTSGGVENGADLSFESQASDLRYFDTFGHGTHMAGIIAGDDPATLLGLGRFRGVAPDAKLTSLKVAASDGAVDVSQVVAAVDWVVEHRNDDPANPIRVLNLSFGTDGVQDYRLDPLTHAVENAWRAGIVVVVSGGNEGTDAPSLNNPAYDPHVIAVGAADTRGTAEAVRRPGPRVLQPRQRRAPGRPRGARTVHRLVARPRAPTSTRSTPAPGTATGCSRAAAPRRPPPWSRVLSRCCSTTGRT